MVAYSPPVIGEIIDGKYRIVGLLGEGGMGAVYEAEHTTTGRDVAVKLINDNAMMSDEVLRARFQREAQAASKVRSAHIVEILDAGQDPSTKHPYMVMDLLQGENVLSALKRLECLAPELVMRVGYQTCLGLSKAHEVGVVHRDIKPANLFLSDAEANELDVKLLDFGVAKFKMDQATETANEALTRTGSMLGSPMYMSPEQARGLKTIDHRADIWSLGVVLYQLLAGHTPYHSIDGLGELIITICSEEPEPLSSKAPWVASGLANAVQKALKLSPEERYQTAKEFGDALLALMPDGRWRIQREMLVAADKNAGEGSAVDDLGDTVQLATAGAPPETPAAGFSGGDSTVALEPHQMPELSGIESLASLGRGVDGEAETERLAAADVAASVAAKSAATKVEVASASNSNKVSPEKTAGAKPDAAGGVPPMLVAILLLVALALAGYFWLPGLGQKGQAPAKPVATTPASTAEAKQKTPSQPAPSQQVPSQQAAAKASSAPSAAASAAAKPSAAPAPAAPAANPTIVPKPWPKAATGARAPAPKGATPRTPAAPAPKKAFVPGAP